MSKTASLRLGHLFNALIASIAMVGVHAAVPDIPRFAPHEVTLRASDHASNPYVQITADATLIEPDGRTTRSVPLFWDGGDTWRFRFSPDTVGTWKWKVESADAGLNGKSGAFACVASTRRGSVEPMGGAPQHFQYQNGERMWFLGDTAWAFVTDRGEEKHNRAAAERYVANRAAQGFNVIHLMLLNEAGWGNRNGPPWTDITTEKINPAYFQEADERIAFANARGVVVGIAMAWGKGRNEPYTWGRLPDLAARLRYARYVATRYGAYDVYFLVSGEWHREVRSRRAPEPEVLREFVQIGDAVRAANPHRRMIGIHPTIGHGSTREFNQASVWMDFGDYQQNYWDLHGRILTSRKLDKPVVNSEYAYWLRDADGDGKVDKAHSYTLADIRAATWDIVMAGGYVVAGFGSTYYGGHRHLTTFLPDDPKNTPWIEEIGRMKQFFTAIEYWKLEPHDDLVTCRAARTGDRITSVEVGGRRLGVTQAPLTTYWCLAEPGRVYVAYVRGTTEPITLTLGGYGPWRAEEFDPRKGATTPLPKPSGDRYEYRPPDAQDWLAVLQAVK